MSQQMMRARVVAQAATVGIMVASSGVGVMNLAPGFGGFGASK